MQAQGRIASYLAVINLKGVKIPLFHEPQSRGYLGIDFPFHSFGKTPPKCKMQQSCYLNNQELEDIQRHNNLAQNKKPLKMVH